MLVRWDDERYKELAGAGENVLSLLPGGVLEPWTRTDQENHREHDVETASTVSGSFSAAGQNA